MSEDEPESEFEPEVMQSMIEALTATIRLLRFSERRAEFTVLAARKIVELARAGERESERLTAAALNLLRH